eukprot:TRINITY_DN80611_c0_g1_i1.p1 TRINITY_DN80611_c0_g1~~TRINITY_DN80611_c0_g1_i1.p1  ORF type:complete len:530 (-),score=162.81 TRINITY_DN80611_c0_g1_i1:187-1776(-)
MATKSFRPRLWLKRHSAAVPSTGVNSNNESEFSFSSAAPNLLLSATSSSSTGDNTAGAPSLTPSTPLTASRKLIKLPPLFSARKNKKDKKSGGTLPAPLNVPKRTETDEDQFSPMAKSAPYESKSALISLEDQFEEDLGAAEMLATSLDEKKNAVGKKNFNTTASKSELSQFNAKAMNEQIKAELQISNDEARSKMLKSLFLTEEPYHNNSSNSGSQLDLLATVTVNGKKPLMRRTALHSAVEVGASVDAVKKLVENLKTVDLFAVTEDGDTALHIAARNRDVEMCKYLIGLGCDPNQPNLAQKTAVQLAGSDLGYIMMFAYWTMMKSKVETNTYGELAIMATKHGALQMLCELAELGADLKAVSDNETGQTLAEIARSSGYMDLASALENDMKKKHKLENTCSLGDVSFSGSLRKMVGTHHGHKHSSSGILDLPSDEVKALMNADTGTDVLVSPTDLNRSESNQGVDKGVKIAHARQLTQDLEMDPEEDCEDNSEKGTDRFGSLEALNNLTNQVTYEKRPSRFTVRDL